MPFALFRKVDYGFRDCGGELEASGTDAAVYSPNYLDNENYPTNTFCIWAITAAPGTHVHIVFQVFHLEHHEDCRFDRLNLYDDTHLTGT